MIYHLKYKHINSIFYIADIWRNKDFTYSWVHTTNIIDGDKLHLWEARIINRYINAQFQAGEENFDR